MGCYWMIYYNKNYNFFSNNKSDNIEKDVAYNASEDKAVENCEDILWRWNVNKEEFHINAIGYNILGIDKYYKSISTKDIKFWMQFIHPDDLEIGFNNFFTDIVIKNKKNFSHGYRIVRSDGSIGRLITSGVSFKNIHGEKIVVEYVCKFIKTRNSYFHRENMNLYPNIGGGIDGVINVDLDKKGICMSPSMSVILDEINFHKNIVNLNQCMDYLPKSEYEMYRKNFNEFLEEDNLYYYEQLKVINKNNMEKYLELRGQKNINKFDKSKKVYISVKDVTKEKEEKRKYSRIKYQDDITGLPNKFYLREFLMKKDVERSLEVNSTMTLMLVDIDDFKEINDKLGYYFGNKLLKTVGEKLKSGAQKGDTVIRFNADEFFIMSEDFNGYTNLRKKAESVIELFKNPVNIEGKNFFVSINIGIVVYPEHGEVFSDLIYKADIAMFKSKSIGKNTFSFFEVENDKVDKIFTMEQDLVKAISKDEMYIMFQPKISTENEKTVGLEALARWNHGKKGMIPPSEFIPIAESTKLIIPIGRFVFEESCKKCRELIDKGYKNFKISVNLSKIQLEDKMLTEFLVDTLKRYKLDPKYIELEITESVIMDALERNLDVLDNIHKYGISMSLDDFGVGLSPIKYLKILNLDCLKIDKSFIDDIGINKKSERIIEGLIKLAHSLNLSVIAEGVETKNQMSYLKKHSCDVVQGYYYAKPMSFEDTIIFLQSEV